jgi:4-hydroxy-2-oxoheptanedioate aldolase
MRMTENPLKQKLATGRPVLGIWSIIPSPIVVEILACAGLDFQILDMEHGVFDRGSLDNCIRAAESAGCSPLVRVPGFDPFAVQTVLDLGAHGVVFPQLGDARAVETAVRSSKYAPRGTRGYNPFTRVAQYDPPPSLSDGKLNNSFGLSAVILETEGAYRELDAVLAMPDLDLLYLGVYDMSLVLGCQGNVGHPRVQDFVRHAAREGRKAGKAVGLLVKSRAEVDSALDLGANVLVWAVDSFLIRNAGSAAVEQFRQAWTQDKGRGG